MVDDRDIVPENVRAYFSNNMYHTGLRYTFSSQNVRSLNISTKNDLTTQKIIAVCSLNTDFIFLSDIRLNSDKQQSAIHDLKKQFFFKGYKLIFNSRFSSRGVGILVKKNIYENNFNILSNESDALGNFLILHLSVNNLRFVVAAVYGPNHDDEVEFFDNLQVVLGRHRDPVIVGGDWNATLDGSRTELNLDVVNMRNIPSARRTEKILQLCNNLNLIDPFRTLFPNKKEYTFIPSAVNQNNRSRLDFFLISKDIFNEHTNCTIPNCLTTTLFDHKPVLLTFTSTGKNFKAIVKDTVLKNIDLPSHVKSAVFECYLHHTVPTRENGGIINEQILQNYLQSLGTINRLLNDIQKLEIKMVLEGFTEIDDLSVRGKRAEINLIFEDLPDLEFFENLPCNHNPSVFFETLSNCIRNNVLSHQSYIFKSKKLKKEKISKNLAELKRNFDQNTNEILRLERTLSDLAESEIKDELLHFKRFECLNNEKITPYFLKLAKNTKNESTLREVLREDGTDFTDDKERSDFIYSYYKEIYKQPENLAKVTSREQIEEFLGDLRFNPIVQNAKLTEAEKLELELDFTVDELTKSINNANMCSAPGADGINNRFIKHFWNFFKNPLFKLCKHSFESGTLPENFRCADIRLIPKKGDLSKIKN